MQFLNTLAITLLAVASAAGCATYTSCKCFNKETNSLDNDLTTKVCKALDGVLLTTGSGDGLKMVMDCGRPEEGAWENW